MARKGAVHRTKPEHGEETRARLLDVARALFAARGHSSVSITAICSRAGVSRGALYHHFAGKDELFRTVCENVATDVSRRVVAIAANAPDPFSRLRAGCLAFVDACCEPDVRQILMLDAPSVLGWQAFRELDGRFGHGHVRIALAAAMESGSIPPVPVDAVAHLLVGAVNEAAMVVGTAPDPTRARRDAQAGIELILDGIASPPSQR